MAVTVRLFAALRDAAGTSQIEVDPAPVREIVDGLCGRFGEPFATRVSVATGLLDGRTVRLGDDTTAPDGSELALLPPFSGGAPVATHDSRLTRALVAGSLLVPALLVLGVQGDRWTFGLVALVVGVGSLVDLHLAMGDTGHRTVLPAALLMALGPGLLVLLVPAVAGAWVAGVVALGVVLTFLLTLASPRRHDTAGIVGATLLAGLLVAFGVTALLLLRDAADSTALTGAIVLIGLTDATVLLLGGRAAGSPVARRAAVAAVVAALGTVGMRAITGEPATLAGLLGLPVAAVGAALLSTRLRDVLRLRATAPRPGLLIGTADAALVGAPLLLTALALGSAISFF